MKLSKRNTAGLTLVEIMISLALILIIVVGAMNFRYSAVMDAREADARITAARVGSMLLSAWVSRIGSPSFDPVAEFNPGIPITVSASGPAVPAGFTELNKYHIICDDVNYYATLSHKPTISGHVGEVTITLSWFNNYGVWSETAVKQSINMTTFVRSGSGY
jgi:type II secretory pathway pseudopilin PulG